MLLTTQYLPGNTKSADAIATLTDHWEGVAVETMHADPLTARAKGSFGPFPIDIWRYIYDVGKLRGCNHLAQVCKGMLYYVCVERYNSVVHHRAKVLMAIGVQLGVYYNPSFVCDRGVILSGFMRPEDLRSAGGREHVFIASVIMSIVYLDSPAFWWLPRSAPLILCPSTYAPHSRPNCCKSVFLTANHSRRLDVLYTLQHQSVEGRLNTSYIQYDGTRFRSRSLLYDLSRDPLMRMVCPGMSEYWASTPECKTLRAVRYPDDILNINWKMDDGVIIPVQDVVALTRSQKQWIHDEIESRGIVDGRRASARGISQEQIVAWRLRHPGVKRKTDKQTTLTSRPGVIITLMDDSDDDGHDTKRKRTNSTGIVCRCPEPIFSGLYCTKCKLMAMNTV